MNQQFKVFVAFFSIYIIWGSTYLLNKVAVAQLPPFFLAGLRFSTAGIILILITWFTKRSIKTTKKQLLNTIIVGFLFLSFGNGVVVWALKYVDSGFAALEIAAQPLVILLLMWVLEGKTPQFMSLIGVVLGFLGIYLLMGQDSVLDKENSLTGALMIFACMVSWAYGSLFVAKADLPKNYLLNTGYQMFFGSIILMAMSVVAGESWVAPTDWKVEVIWVMVLLVLFGSIVAFTAFNFLLKSVSPEKVATSTYVNPIVALILGWYFLGEHIPLQSILAALVLLTGVYFINAKKKLVMFNRFRKSQRNIGP